MKAATGFITQDGTFFESEKEAVLHEAETRLRWRMGIVFPQLNQQGFFEALLELMPEIGDYIDAFEAEDSTKRPEPEDEIRGEDTASEPAKVNDSLGHISSTEEDLTSLLQLPARGSVNVSDVGSRARAAKVSDRRKKHGA